MRTIYKYAINLVAEKQRLCIYEDSQLLSVQIQGGKLCVWAMIDDSSPVGMVRFHIYGTGNVIPDDFKAPYLGTVQQNGYVWHVFYEWV